MDFPFPSFLPWAFVTAVGVAYVLLREDADRIDRLALSGALGAGHGRRRRSVTDLLDAGCPPFLHIILLP